MILKYVVGYVFTILYLQIIQQQTQTMPTFGVGEPTTTQAEIPPQVLPVGTATLNGTVSLLLNIKRYFLSFLVQIICLSCIACNYGDLNNNVMVIISIVL